MCEKDEVSVKKGVKEEGLLVQKRVPRPKDMVTDVLSSRHTGPDQNPYQTFPTFLFLFWFLREM